MKSLCQLFDSTENGNTIRRIWLYRVRAVSFYCCCTTVTLFFFCDNYEKRFCQQDYPRRTFHFSISSCFVLYCRTRSSKTFFSPSELVLRAGTTSLTVRSTNTPLIIRKHFLPSGNGSSVSSTSLICVETEVSFARRIAVSDWNFSGVKRWSFMPEMIQHGDWRKAYLCSSASCSTSPIFCANACNVCLKSWYRSWSSTRSQRGRARRLQSTYLAVSEALLVVPLFMILRTIFFATRTRWKSWNLRRGSQLRSCRGSHKEALTSARIFYFFAARRPSATLPKLRITSPRFYHQWYSWPRYAV